MFEIPQEWLADKQRDEWIGQLEAELERSKQDKTPLTERGLELYHILGKRSLYFLSKFILGYDKLTTPLHFEIAALVEHIAEFKKLLILLPRGHYKTTLVTKSFPIWCLIQDQIKVSGRAIKGCDFRALISHESARKACNMILEMEGSVETDFFKAVYPGIIPDKPKRWSEQAMEVNRTRQWSEASIEAIGASGASQSAHYDLLVGDDWVGEEAKDSPTVMAKTIDWWEHGDALLISPEKSWRIGIGTRWAMFDLYQWIIDNNNAEKGGEYTVYTRQVIEDGEPLCPTILSMEGIQLIKAKSFFWYSTQYLNNPKDPENVDIDIRRIKKYRRAFDTNGELFFELLDTGEKVYPSHMDRIIGADPNIPTDLRVSRRMGSAAGLSAWGIDANNRVYLLEGWRNTKATEDQFIDQAYELYDRWSAREFCLESYGAFRILGWVFKKENAKEERSTKMSMPDKGVTGGGRNKDVNIRAVYRPIVNQGRMYVPEAGYGVEFFDEEICIFPLGKFKDLLDSGTCAIPRLIRPSSDLFDEPEEGYDSDFDDGRSSTTGY